ncbi:MAG TPA: hypothetical protein VN495_01005 [Candidatus Paceibacterota bacterium]|nr:hypothetical protein [Candidatus Paceibacterota bacterium]
MPNHDEMLKETYRLARENNVMLHKIRRTAFWGRMLTLAFYAALLLAPIWFYLTYLNGTVQHLLNAYDKMQGTGTQAETQFQQFEDSFKQLQQKFQTIAGTSSSSSNP